jgi:hypothetical protein
MVQESKNDGLVSTQRWLLNLSQRQGMTGDCSKKDSVLWMENQRQKLHSLCTVTAKEHPTSGGQTTWNVSLVKLYNLSFRLVVQDKQWPNISTWTFNKMVVFLALPRPNGSPGVTILHKLFHEDLNCQYVKDKFICTVLKLSDTSRVSVTKTPSVHIYRCTDFLHDYPQRVLVQNRNSSANS